MKNIWITGASSGIGRELANQLASKDTRLIISARNKEELEAVKNSIDTPVVVVPMDATRHEKIFEIVDQVIQEYGAIDTLICSAGISQRSKVMDTDFSTDKRIIDINFFGVIAHVKAVLPSMKENGKGKVVVISSVTGKIGIPNRATYSASKHAIHGYFDALRAEVFEFGIDVNIICPGYVRTAISENAITGDGGKHGVMDIGQRNGLSVEDCATQIIKAMKKNRAETLIGGKETKFVLVKRLFPGYVEKRLRTFNAQKRN